MPFGLVSVCKLKLNIFCYNLMFVYNYIISSVNIFLNCQ